MKWQLFQNNWWLLLEGANPARWVGYYPATIFNNGADWASYFFFGGPGGNGC